jgi:haloalkane dehalogenase
LIIGDAMAAWCVQNMASLEVEHCGPAGHLAPEDQPEAIAAAIVGWADRHRLRESDTGGRQALRGVR